MADLMYAEDFVDSLAEKLGQAMAKALSEAIAEVILESTKGALMDAMLVSFDLPVPVRKDLQ